MMRGSTPLLLLLAALFTGALCGGPSDARAADGHERLRLRNTFQKPEDVVAYYCARDASGFIWSGMLDLERAAFTSWSDVPQQDSFLIARTYRVLPARIEGDEARVTVEYELLGVGDAHGTRGPAPDARLTITFILKRIGGAWKIQRPEGKQLAPVVLQSKFPVVASR